MKFYQGVILLKVGSVYFGGTEVCEVIYFLFGLNAVLRLKESDIERSGFEDRNFIV